MKDISLMVWLTQLGLSVALPPVGFILLARWLQNRFAWRSWVFWVALVLGLICAVDGLRTSLKTLERISRDREQKDPPPVSFNDHD